jgi:hypothetical protein
MCTMGLHGASACFWSIMGPVPNSNCTHALPCMAASVIGWNKMYFKRRKILYRLEWSWTGRCTREWEITVTCSSLDIACNPWQCSYCNKHFSPGTSYSKSPSSPELKEACVGFPWKFSWGSVHHLFSHTVKTYLRTYLISLRITGKMGLDQLVEAIMWHQIWWKKILKISPLTVYLIFIWLTGDKMHQTYYNIMPPS